MSNQLNPESSSVALSAYNSDMMEVKELLIIVQDIWTYVSTRFWFCPGAIDRGQRSPTVGHLREVTPIPLVTRQSNPPTTAYVSDIFQWRVST